MNFIRAQSGKLLLLASIVVTAASIALNRPQELPEVSASDIKRPVMVELKKDSLSTAKLEVFFSPDPGKDNQQFWSDERCLFEKEKKVKPFTAVELDLPPATVMRPPQVLPDPGPALGGTLKLPRYGDEFPALVIPAPEPKK